MQHIKSSNEVIIAQQIQGDFFTNIINRTYWLPVSINSTFLDLLAATKLCTLMATQDINTNRTAFDED